MYYELTGTIVPVLFLTKLVTCIKITAELAERLRKAAGFRNISVHGYKKIDWEIVFSICTKHMNDFRAYAAKVLAYFEIK